MSDTSAAQNVHSFQVDDINGNSVNLNQYAGKVLLIVNTASKCGYTPQYAGLQELYEKHQAKGFEVLAFPANNFGAQEPGSNEEIKEFCDLRFKVKFPLFSKISVKGGDIHPLYDYLTNQSEYPGEVKWNFGKFLVASDGNVVARYDSGEEPMGEKISADIEAQLG